MQNSSSSSKGFRNNGWNRVILLVTSIIILLICSLLSSCKHIEYVTVPEVHTEHIYHNDTVKVTDSIKHEKETIIREARPEDSIMLANMGIKLQANERLLIMLQRELENAKSELIEHKSDSVFIKDTISVPYPVEKIVKEKYTPKFTKFLAWVGGIVGIAAIIVLIIYIIRFIPKVKKILGII